MSKVMTRVFDVKITMVGEPCELTKEEAAEYVRKQVQGLYPEQAVVVECNHETVEEK